VVISEDKSEIYHLVTRYSRLHGTVKVYNTVQVYNNAQYNTGQVYNNAQYNTGQVYNTVQVYNIVQVYIPSSIFPPVPPFRKFTSSACLENVKSHLLVLLINGQLL
jgi:hypothetical protein